MVLSDIFGKNMDKFISKQENTDIALKVYEEEILKGNGIVLDNIEDMIQDSNGELQYNFIMIKERFDEMQGIFEKEVFPIKEARSEIVKTFDLKKLNEFDKKYNANTIMLNDLTKQILSKYILNQ
jgi:hypothetical protein